MFPNKPAAAREFARVLKPGGLVGLSDITRAPGPSGELADLMAGIACLADARPADSYAAWLTAAGFTPVAIEPHDDALIEMIRRIGTRLFAAERTVTSPSLIDHTPVVHDDVVLCPRTASRP
jgi:arsenite methyltransferase